MVDGSNDRYAKEHSKRYVKEGHAREYDVVKNVVKEYDIITVGSAVVDAFVKTAPSDSEILHIHHHVDMCYPLGSKILVDNLEFFTGGGGTNSAVAFSRMGLRTAFLGMIGNDNNSKMILDELHRENIDFIGKRGETSGFSVILDAIAKDRTVFAYKGCNDDLSGINKKNNEKNLKTKWFYFSSMLGKSFKTQEFLANYGKKNGIKIAFNPSLYIAKKGAKYLKNIISNTEILILNKEEIQALLNIRSNNVFQLLYEASMIGPKIICVTDGDKGVHCYDSYNKEFYSVDAKKIHVVEATGAGDAFASGFVAGRIKNYSISNCLKIGMLNSESVIKYRGAKNILLGEKIFHTAEKDNRKIVVNKLRH